MDAYDLDGGPGRTDGVLHIGDLCYATGWLAKWELFMNQIEPLASRYAASNFH